MALANTLRRVIQKSTGRPAPRLLTVKSAAYLTPNMIRVTFAGDGLAGFPTGHEGGNCKLMIPDIGEGRAAFADRLRNGPPPVRRTYTVRHFRSDVLELDVDFVAHGDNGPASRWASHAKPGDVLGFAGPSGPKVTNFDADWYLVAADPSALPVAAATLEAMPRDATGIAIFEITAAEDVQSIAAPSGVDLHWLVNPDPSKTSPQQEDFIRNLDWPMGRVQTCIAGESGVIKPLRAFLAQEKNIPRSDTYISGYWKIGMVEDEHQKAKRADA